MQTQFGRRRRTGYSAGTRYLDDPGHHWDQEDSIVLFSNRSRSIFPFACAFDDNIIRKYPTHCGEPPGGQGSTLSRSTVVPRRPNLHFPLGCISPPYSNLLNTMLSGALI